MLSLAARIWREVPHTTLDSRVMVRDKSGDRALLGDPINYFYMSDWGFAKAVYTY